MMSKKIIKSNIKIIGNILEILNEVFILLKPLIKEIISLKESGMLQNKAEFIRAASLFNKITEECKSLEFQDFPEEFLKNIMN